MKFGQPTTGTSVIHWRDLDLIFIGGHKHKQSLIVPLPWSQGAIHLDPIETRTELTEAPSTDLMMAHTGSEQVCVRP